MYADRIARLKGELLVRFHSDTPEKQMEAPRGTTASTMIAMHIGIGPIIRNGIVFKDWDVLQPGNRISLVNGLTPIDFAGITDAGYGTGGLLDDGLVPIPMTGTFNFFGTNYSSAMKWSSNNAIIFGTYAGAQTLLSNIPPTVPSILFGNYDRMLKSLSYSNTTVGQYTITTLLPTFYNYYFDQYLAPNTSPNPSPVSTTYTYQLRIIKETIGPQRQFIEVAVVSSPPMTGYSSAITSYPSGSVDTNGNAIDATKQSPYNITNGTAFLNPCESTFSLTSPVAGTSFVFASDSTGSQWTFSNNSFVNI